MADTNSSFDSTTTGSTYGSKKSSGFGSSSSKDYLSDASLSSTSSESHSFMDSLNELPGIDSLKNVGSFVRANWMMIVGVGAALGVGAYLFRGKLPLLVKSGRKLAPKIAKMASHKSAKRKVSSARA